MAEPLSGASLHKLGYRQRAVLKVLRTAGKPVPFGYVVRQCDDGCPSHYNNTNVSLRALRARGLARQVRLGLWEAVA